MSVTTLYRYNLNTSLFIISLYVIQTNVTLTNNIIGVESAFQPFEYSWQTDNKNNQANITHNLFNETEFWRLDA